jgi:hypothetical protein
LSVLGLVIVFKVLPCQILARHCERAFLNE